MGNESGSVSSQHGDAKELYWACQNGDAHKVNKMLPLMTHEQISAVAHNGNTVLHAASYNGHATIVKMLLAHGCDRSTLNGQGSTAYQVAKNDEIRNLFKRPDSVQSRYMSTDVSDLFQVTPDEETDDVPDNWVRGHATTAEATDAQFVVAVHRSSFFRKLVQSKVEEESDAVLKDLVEQEIICNNHQESSKAYHLLKNFLRRGKRRVDHLIKLYTLETPFYAALHNDNSAFTSVLYLHLNEYRDRAFEGHSYRGASMTAKDLEAYKWAHENDSRVLETCTIQSTSLNRKVAEYFAEKYATPNKYKVLFIFKFSQKCETAIALSHVNEQLRGLSEFEDEDEVLILPYTLFKVTNIRIRQKKSQCCEIFLTNVRVPEKSVLSAWLDI